MPSPEIEPKALSEQVKHVESRFQPEVEKSLQEVGVQVQPQSAGQITNDQGQVIVQSTDPDDQSQQIISIPVGQETADKWARGNVGDSQTWLGKHLLRKIAMAVHSGFKVIVGKT